MDDLENPSMAIVFEKHSCYVEGDIVSTLGIDKIMLLARKNHCIRYDIIPQNDSIRKQLEEWQLPSDSPWKLTKTYRHLMEINKNDIDKKKLYEFRNQLPKEYEIQSINASLFQIARKDRYLAQFIENYKDYEEFVEHGFGFFLISDHEIIAGISSYVYYQTGVEVQVAVNPQHRGKHLARILGAYFLLECDKRNLYPWWDCANPYSERIALHLGYTLKQVTPVYRLDNRGM